MPDDRSGMLDVTAASEVLLTLSDTAGGGDILVNRGAGNAVNASQVVAVQMTRNRAPNDNVMILNIIWRSDDGIVY